MKKKINVAELLRDCPSGMELDCVMYEDVYFDYVDELNIIHCYIKNEGFRTSITFNQHGTPNSDIKSKCVIFPKSKTTWEGFVPSWKFKDGDIISDDNIVAIFYKLGTPQHCTSSDVVYYHCFYNQKYCEFRKGLDYGIGYSTKFKHATEEEKEKLFQAIKDNGYSWNSETKNLGKLPRFKVGNRIKQIGFPQCHIIKTIEFDRYILNNDKFVRFRDEHLYELVPNKFDISALKPFESRVLVRDGYNDEWRGQFFSHYCNSSAKPYICIGIKGLCEYKQCIPYEDNEHLLGTTNDCDDFYKIW